MKLHIDRENRIGHRMSDHRHGDPDKRSQAREWLTRVFSGTPTVEPDKWVSRGEDRSEANCYLLVDHVACMVTTAEVRRRREGWYAGDYSHEVLVGRSEYAPGTENDATAPDLTRAHARKKAEEIASKILLDQFAEARDQFRRTEALQAAQAASPELAAAKAEVTRLNLGVHNARKAVDAIEARIAAEVDAKFKSGNL